MEFSLGRRSDYSLRAVLHLARHDDRVYRSCPTIAAAMDVPAAWLSELLTKLVDAAIVESRGGRNGGYRLAVDPAEVSLLAVVDAVEPDRVATCVFRSGPCLAMGPCPFHEPWTEAKDALRDRLAATTFADVVAAGAHATPTGLGGVPPTPEGRGLTR